MSTAYHTTDPKATMTKVYMIERQERRKSEMFVFSFQFSFDGRALRVAGRHRKTGQWVGLGCIM